MNPASIQEAGDIQSAIENLVYECNLEILSRPQERREIVVKFYRTVADAFGGRWARIFMSIRQLEGDGVSNVINISQSNGTQVVIDSKVQTINSTITQLSSAGGDAQNVAAALSAMVEVVTHASDLQAETQKEVVECLALLAKQAVKPAAERENGIVRSVLATLPSLLSSASSLGSLWAQYGPALEGFFLS